MRQWRTKPVAPHSFEESKKENDYVWKRKKRTSFKSSLSLRSWQCFVLVSHERQEDEEWRGIFGCICMQRSSCLRNHSLPFLDFRCMCLSFFSSQRTQNTRRLVLVCPVMSLDNWLGVFNVVSGSIDWREDTRMYNSWMRNRLEKQQQMHMRINGKRGSRFTVIRWLESKVLVCMNTIRSQRDFLLVLEEKKIML